MRLTPLFVAASFLFTTNISFAQNCNFVKNETDKFTKVKSVLTEPASIIDKNVKLKRVYNIKKIEMQLRAEGDKRSLIIKYYFILGLTVATTFDKATLLLTNGATVELPCLQDMPNQDHKGFGGGTAILTYEYGISAEAFDKLCASDITDMRMTARVNPIEFSLTEGLSTRGMFRCIR